MTFATMHLRRFGRLLTTYVTATTPAARRRARTALLEKHRETLEALDEAWDKGGDLLRRLCEQRIALNEQREIIAEQEANITQLLAERDMLLHVAHERAPHHNVLLCTHCAEVVAWDGQ